MTRLLCFPNFKAFLSPNISSVICCVSPDVIILAKSETLCALGYLDFVCDKLFATICANSYYSS